jgi:anti-sigma factor RsiW
VREWLPQHVAGRLEAEARATVEGHVVGCDACRAELDLVNLLYESRAEAPAQLADRVIDAVTQRSSAVRRPWWGLSAAAVAAIALGIGITSEGTSFGSAEGDALATEFEEGEFWVSDDGMLAGAPSFDGLSDEALLELLEELVEESPGGSA